MTVRHDVLLRADTLTESLRAAAALSTEAIELYLEYQRHSLPAELHVYEQGGHGFGAQQRGLPVDGWLDQAAQWMESSGFFSKASADGTAKTNDWD